MIDPRLQADFAADPSPAVGGERCPSPEEIWTAVGGGLSLERRLEIVDHTALCAACALEWRLAREMDAAAHVRASVARGRAWGRWALAAAAMLVAVAGVAQLAVPTSSRAYRAVQEGAVQSRLAADGALDAAAFRLSWTPGPAGARYDVRIATEDLHVIFRAVALDETFVVVPSEALAGVPDGSRLLWQVDAVLADGRRISSPTFAQRVRAGGA